MTEGKEVVKRTKAKPPAIPEDCFGATDDIEASDITIGRIAIMQSTSDLVKHDKAKQGAIVNLLDGKQLGFKDETPMEFIPIKSVKYWIEKNADTEEYIKRRPAVSSNELPWEENIDGVNVKRIYTHSFYVILPEEVKNLEAMPLELAFRSTDLQAAQKLSAMLFKLKKRGEASWNRIFKLSTHLKQKDNYSWFGSMIEVDRATTEDEKIEAYNWYKTISDAAVSIVHQEEKEESKTQDDIPF